MLLGALAAGDELGALLLAEPDVLLDGVALRRAHQRAHAGRHVHGVADLDALDAGDHLLDELVVDLLVHQHARPGLADLALVHEGAEERAEGGGVEVGVVEDDVGRLAAELERDLLQGAGAELHDAAADLGRAGEGDLADVGMGRELLAGRAARTADDVDHAGGHAGLGADLAEHERRDRRHRRRLQHDAVAGRERGRDLPRRHDEREVPRRDAGADADRLAHDQVLADGIGTVSSYSS